MFSLNYHYNKPICQMIAIKVNKLLKIIEKINQYQNQKNRDDCCIFSFVHNLFKTKTPREQRFNTFINKMYQTRNFITVCDKTLIWGQGRGYFHKVIRVDKLTHYDCCDEKLVIKDLEKIIGIVDLCEIGLHEADYQMLKNITIEYQIQDLLDEKN